MKKFDYKRAETFTEAEQIQKEQAQSVYLAGGTDLLGVMKADILPQYPGTLIDLKRIPNAKGIREEDGMLKIGALTTLQEIETSEVIKEKAGILAEAAKSVATPLIRNTATIGGNICQDVRCWFYRYPHEAAGRLVCARKGGEQCYAIQGDNRYHSIFGGMKTGKTPCTVKCPANTDIPGYMEKIRMGDWDGAIEILMRVNPMPMCTSRICPHVCQDGCNQCEHGDCVSIHSVERKLGDRILADTDKYYRAPSEESGKSVAVLGAGPSGLTAAYYLRKAGHAVAVYDQMDEPGGVLMYGIPAYRLPKSIVRTLTGALEKMGLCFKMNTVIGQDISLDDIREQNDSVYIATGAWKQPILGLDGENLTQFGLNFLVEVNKYLKGKVGKEVLVCGGGNVAMDVALVSKRLGVEKVRMVCLEQREEMPAGTEEIARALEEGVEIINGRGLSRVIYDENGHVKGMETNQCISVRDENGFFNPQYDNSDLQVLESDCIILATGQRVDLGYLSESMAKQIKSGRGLIDVDENNASKIPGVYGGGDAATGPNLAIQAIAAGGNAARKINIDLGMNPCKPEEEATLIHCDVKRVYDKIARSEKDLPVDQRNLTTEDNSTLSEEEALSEAGRCMNCGCYAVNPSDIAPVLVALDATIVTTERRISAQHFACSKLRVKDILHSGEIVTSVEIPIEKGAVMHYDKFRLRESVDFAIVSLSSIYGVENGIICGARLVLGGVAPIPLRKSEVERFLIGREITEENAAKASELAVKDAVPFEKNVYKVNEVKALVRRSIMRLK
ncbi:MAG: FAD binding domain-containing protein [Clostridiales bacterium]|nr:FAD binding domain-containing protein [Clostridiales bacterium]